jgi:hypothetical protein
VSNGSQRVGSMGLSTLVALVDGASDFRGSTGGSEGWGEHDGRRIMTSQG